MTTTVSPPRPESIKRLVLVLTSQCNLRCGYCYQDDKKAGTMEWETLRGALDLALASEQKLIKFTFYGGEPLLEFPLMERGVRYVEEMRGEEKQVRFGIITNGTLLTEESIDFLIQHDFKTQISFDGVREAQIHRGKGTYEKLDRVLDTIAAASPSFFRKRVVVSSTLTPETIPYLADSIDYFLSKNVTSISVSPSISHHPNWKMESIWDLDEQFGRILETSITHHRRTGETPFTPFRGGINSSKGIDKISMCGVMRGETPTVDVDGQVHGCALFADSFQSLSRRFLREKLESLRMGDIQDERFRERYAAFPEAVEQAEIFHNKQDKYSSYGKCGECEHLASCSICPVSIGNIPGNNDVHRVPDFACAYHLVMLRFKGMYVEDTRVVRSRLQPKMSDSTIRLRNLARRMRGAEEIRR